MKGNAGNKIQSNIYTHVNRQLKSRVSQEVCSPKNTKNTPQIVTEGREKTQELRSHRAQRRCHHTVGIKNEESTRRRKWLKQTNPKEGEKEKQARKWHQGSATDSPE